jgi:hypothetical protein
MVFSKKIKQWFNTKKELTITDKIFGKMILKEFSNSNLNYWSGTAFFEPTQTTIEYFIYTKDQNRPTSQQYIFYSSLNQNYYPLSNLWRKVIDDEIGENLLDMEIHLDDTPLEICFQLGHIEIPTQFNNNARWSVTFFAVPSIDLNHEFTIKMEGWNTLGLFING